MSRLKRFVSEIPVDFDYSIDKAIEACEPFKRNVVVVGGYFKFYEYFRIRKAIKKLNPEIKVFYRIHRPESNRHHSEEPYFLEVDCFKFKN